MKTIRCSALAVACVLAACGGDSPTAPPGPPALLVKNGGDNQSWFFSNPLPAPYAVVVRDSANKAIPGVTVDWAVTTGGGSLSAAQSVTDNRGIATIVHTLGPSVATQTVTASVTSLTPATFTAAAAAPPASATVDLNNQQFSPSVTGVAANGSVTWTWVNIGISHNVSFTTGPAPLPMSSGTRTSGMFGVTFATVGRYHYVCTVHSGMEGDVYVLQ